MRLLDIKLLLGIATAIAVQANGIAAEPIRTHCQGQGPLIHLIGGGPAFTTWHLRPIQQKLDERYTVCRWDMRGVGDNADLPLESNEAALSQWLDDMAMVLPPEPMMLWGHSWGALQVMLFARQHPERVRKLILSNPVDPALRGLEHIEQKRFSHPESHPGLSLEDMGTPAEDLYNLRSKVAGYFVDGEQGWEYAAQFSHEDTNSRLNVRVWDEYRDAPLTASDVKELAPKISGLIYCQDDVLQPEALKEYRRLLPTKEHHVLTGCAHFPWEENPDAYYSVILELLDEGEK